MGSTVFNFFEWTCVPSAISSLFNTFCFVSGVGRERVRILPSGFGKRHGKGKHHFASSVHDGVYDVCYVWFDRERNRLTDFHDTQVVCPSLNGEEGREGEGYF